MNRLHRLIAASALVALAAGCTSRGPASRPSATPPAPETSTPSAPRAPRVAVVDLTRAMRVHPRWPEVTALDRQISGLEVKIVAATQNRPATAIRLDVPRVDLTPEMRAAVERMRPELQQQAEAVKAAARKELEAFVAELRAEQQKKVDAKRAELEAQLVKAMQDKQQANSKDNQQFQQQTLAEYRLPLLNLKLKIEDVQQSGKGEVDKLQGQLAALTKERDDKIAAHEKVNQQALQDFQKAQIEASNAQLKAYETELTKDGQRRVDERAAQLTAQVRAKLDAMQAQFNQRLRQQQTSIVSTARDAQTREVERMKSQAEQQFRQQVQAEVAKVRALQEELLAAQRGRARLYRVILADLRVEAAALAQEKGWDLVLTQTIAAPGAIDGTDELIARIRR
jgi:Skp family chaperone for outer membrane proteins